MKTNIQSYIRQIYDFAGAVSFDVSGTFTRADEHFHLADDYFEIVASVVWRQKKRGKHLKHLRIDVKALQRCVGMKLRIMFSKVSEKK